METFSERLLALMKARGITQKELSAIAGISQGTISKYLNGQEPKSAELCRLARTFGVTMDFLYSGQNSPVGMDANLRAEVAERKLAAIKKGLTAILKEF